jgi:hypothetical protein
MLEVPCAVRTMLEQAVKIERESVEGAVGRMKTPARKLGREAMLALEQHLQEEWILQLAHNATNESSGLLRGQQYLHDRDTKFCPAFLDVLVAACVD